MGRIIQKSGGKTTVYVNGVNINGLTPLSNTYYVGVDLASGYYEKLNPTGTIVNLEGNFTGGTVPYPTNFTGGLSATTFSATTYLNLPVDTFTGGTVNGATNFTSSLSATTFSATTYLNLPVDTFTGGTVNGVTNFTGGLSATTFSATTYLNLPPSGCINVTYSELVTLINGDELSAGVHYLITDFKTCYDQPDFDYNNNPITSGNSKQGPVEPLMVLATSANTISTDAYQPAYPNDKIRYDWSFSATEVTNSAAFGRITERVDEFNNRTDYDHRNILFKRYRLYTYRQDQPLNGTIAITGTGPNNVSGTTTQFTNLSVGDVIYVPGVSPSYYEIINISGDTLMSITGDTLSSFGAGLGYYKTIEENNGNGYFSYKQTNVKTDDFIEYTTFGDAIANDYVKNTYVGNYANNYTNVGYGTFILANNVFLEGQYESNKFGDYCYNNTFGTDNQNNVWGDWCYENVSVNDIDNNIIGHNFNNNLINANLVDNHIGNDFNNNRLLGENGTYFEDNIIGNGFNNNLIYHGFYKNEILDNFNDNTIGDFGNLDNFNFYRNYIRNNFNNNTIRQNFQNNQIGTNYQGNEINGESQGNTILNGFVGNVIGSYFSVNNIGNAFNNNNISDSFYQNTTDYQFNNNVISYEFNNNNIGKYFVNNEPSNLNLFGWSDLSTVSTRIYSTFNNSLDGAFGKILGKELVMEVTSTLQYFKIKFTQWSTNDNGFQYTREEIDSSGNSLGPVITFTLVNGGTDVDYIVPGVVEITRSGTQPIYNSFAEPGWDNSVSPSGTSWNSIYTEPNNGQNFAYNKIGNNFNSNTIDNDFGSGGGQNQGNVINEVFENNTIGQSMYNNVIGNHFVNNTVGDNFENNAIKNYFASNTVGDVFESNTIGDVFNTNTIGDNFESNTIKNYFIGNSILNGFESNEIGDYFGNSGSGPGSPVQNIIFDDFKYNKIGNFFGNDTNFPTVGGGSNGDGGNIINIGFQFNVIGDNFIFNAIDEGFRYNQIGNHFWLNVFGVGTESNILGNYFVGNGGGDFPLPMGDYFASNKFGNYVAFNWFTGLYFQNNNIGNFFGTAAEFPAISNRILDNFQNNTIGNYFGYDPITPGDGGNYIEVDFQNNKIGNNFTYNATYGTFSDNVINNDFTSNIVYDNFNYNRIDTAIDTVDFTTYLSGVTSISFSSVGIGTPGTYTGLTSTGGSGSGATFDVVVDAFSAVTSVSINDMGQNYITGNTLTIDGALYGGVGGVDSISISVLDVNIPSVYQTYNCQLFEIGGGAKKLSYYDDSSVLVITDVNL